MSPPTARCAPATLVLMLSTLAAPAYADNAAEAFQLTRDAEKLMADGKIGEACNKLDKAFELDPRGSAALELAICREKEGKLASAYRAYGVAADLAKKEKRSDRLRTANSKRSTLTMKLPKLTVVVQKASRVQGLVVKINGGELPPASYSKPYYVDPGELNIEATAAGHETWTKQMVIQKAQRKQFILPKLSKAAAPPPAPAPAPVAPAPAGSEPTEPPPPEPKPPPQPREPGGGLTEHEDGRLIVEVAALGGFLFSDIERDDISALTGTSYQYKSSSGGFFVATCGDTTTIPGAGDCTATFESASGGLVGGQAFVGWALADFVTVGARGMGAVRFPDGWFFVGGPSISFNAVGPLWVGASFMVGASRHTAKRASATGNIPTDLVELNGAERINIPETNLRFDEGEIGTGFMFGGSLELGIELVGPSHNAIVPVDVNAGVLNGAVMISAWPAIFAAPEGMAIAVPGGIGYRFH